MPSMSLVMCEIQALKLQKFSINKLLKTETFSLVFIENYTTTVLIISLPILLFQVLPGATDPDCPRVIHLTLAIQAQYIRIHPLSSQIMTGMRLEMFGCHDNGMQSLIWDLI